MTTDLQTRSLSLRAIREESREVDFVCSTEAIDSYDSVLRQNWRLDRFKANPVVLFAHESRELPIGHASNVRVERKQLLATIKLSTAEANPKAEHVWQSIRQGSLRGLSVGFYPHKVGQDEVGGRPVLVLDDLELLELSVTPIPANPDCLAKLRQRAVAAEDVIALGATPADVVRAGDLVSIGGSDPVAIKTTAAPSPPGTPATERGEQKEIRMDFEKECAALKAKLDQRDADVTARDKAIETERNAKVALEREVEKAREDAKAANERAAKAEAGLVERDVDALVGKKITPAEREEMLELAKANRSLFDRIVAKREMLGGADGLASGKSAIGADPAATAERATGASVDPTNEVAFRDFMKSRKG